MPGLPDNASENGKPGAKIKGSSEKKGLKARSPNFPLLQIWLRLHHFMTMTEEQTLFMFFWPSVVRFYGFLHQKRFWGKKIIITKIVETHEFSIFMRAKKLWENKLVKTHEFFDFHAPKKLRRKRSTWSIFYFQFWLTLHYLMTMTDEQTLVMYSGHPMGLFPSRPENPRLIITNGMVIPNYSTKEDYDRMFGLGVTMYDIPNIFPYSFPYSFYIIWFHWHYFYCLMFSTFLLRRQVH